MSWIIQRTRRPGAALRLYCFAHAGGSPGEYAFWGDELEALEVRAIQLPGRGSRYDQPALASVPALRDAVLDGVAFEPPFAFFGHSFGAILAFEVARALEARGAGPRWLVASAARAPHLPSRLAPIAHLDDAALVAALHDDALRALLDDPDMLELVAPALRGDLAAAEAYRYVDGPPLRCPVHVLGGTADDLAPDELAAWQRHAATGWSLTMLPGDHFFTRSLRGAVLAHLATLAAAP